MNINWLLQHKKQRSHVRHGTRYDNKIDKSSIMSCFEDDLLIWSNRSKVDWQTNAILIIAIVIVVIIIVCAGSIIIVRAAKKYKNNSMRQIHSNNT